VKRGFKSLCEKLALSYRDQLGLYRKSSLCPHSLAKHLEVVVLTPEQILNVSQSSLDILLNKEKSSWSAVALTFNGTNAIIYNGSHAKSRQTNDIMHELSHIILKHQPSTMHHQYETGIFLRDYDKEQEEEADFLASTLLLPKDVLMDIKYLGIEIKTAAKKYSVSPALINMRLNTSGVNVIYKRTRKRKR
jgi:Zn-dependent peptidase ImmA (M78 family)